MNSWFTRRLTEWNRLKNKRDMPWKGEKDPYRIWLSEVILQQTRVEQGWAYYHRFIEKYPDIHTLAAAPDQEVFKLWEGLGYYSRCRNLLVTARHISKEYEGRFPAAYEQIKALKGIGPYTAAAIASFAFDQPYAVVDGNVYRVLARCFGIDMPVDQPAGRRLFTRMAEELLDMDAPGRYNQAIMDFGATICKPRDPACPTCPMKKNCHAFRQHKVASLPVKAARRSRKTRWMYYLLIEKKGKILVRERQANDVWRHLFELYLIETNARLTGEELKNHPAVRKWNGGKEIADEQVSPEYQQQLTHQQIKGRFLHLRSSGALPMEDGYFWVSSDQFGKLPFPRYILSYLKEKK